MLITTTDLLEPRKIPAHGTRGTTRSEGCLLLYSAERGVNPVEVAAPVRGQKAVGQADFVDGEPDVAVQAGTPPGRLPQVDLEVAVPATLLRLST